MKKDKFIVRIKGANKETMNDIKHNIEDYNTYVQSGNIKVHDEGLEKSGVIYIEMMITNKVIIRRSKHLTTIYISNDELLSSLQIQILHHNITGVSMEY